jgi:hypothetical protein
MGILKGLLVNTINWGKNSQFLLTIKFDGRLLEQIKSEDTLRDVQLSIFRKSFHIESGYMIHTQQSTKNLNFSQSRNRDLWCNRSARGVRLHKSSASKTNSSLPKSKGFLPDGEPWND